MPKHNASHNLPAPLPLIRQAHAYGGRAPFYFGVARHAKGRLIKYMHTHSGVELGVIRSGRAHFRYGQDEYILNEGDCYFLDSMIPHMHGATAESGFKSLWLHIRDISSITSFAGAQGDSRLLQPFLDLRSGALPVFKDGRAARLLLQGFAAMRTRRPCADIYAWGCILGALARISGKPSVLEQRGARPGYRESEATLRKAIAFICETRGKPVSLRDIAEHCCLSESRLSSLFTSTLRISPIAYRNQVRIHRAAERIATTSDKVSEIARQAGFKSVSQFHRLFKRITGTTPDALRPS